MRVLFVHQNFPGQFKHLAPALARQGHEVSALTMVQNAHSSWQGVHLHRYRAQRSSTRGVHPWVMDLETKAIRGEAAFLVALQLKANGYVPDAIVAHPGWGESLFLKEVWPQARMGLYCEFYYGGHDSNFDPEFWRDDPTELARLRMKNANAILHFDLADAALSPTRWQASTYPKPFADRISVVHDGIDTDLLRPDSDSVFILPTGEVLRRGDEVVTFVNRNFEPYRGYHVFMRALPDLLRERPQARVVLVGGDEVSYGAKPPEGTTWKQLFWTEIQGQLDASMQSRIHFVGKLAYTDFVKMLQVSMVHVYLTYPFVLSWSLLEAMSVGCAVVASDTQPLKEVVAHGQSGRLVGFFDGAALVEQILDLLNKPAERARLGRNARDFVRQRYDLNSVCLPQQVKWVESLNNRLLYKQ